MSEQCEIFRAMRGIAQDERRQRREAAPERLRAAGLAFTSFNGGAHLRIEGIDFWPGTEKWTRPDGRRRHGIEELIEFIKGRKSA